MDMCFYYSHFHFHFHKKGLARRLALKQKHQLPNSEVLLHAVTRTSKMEAIYIKAIFLNGENFLRITIIVQKLLNRHSH